MGIKADFNFGDIMKNHESFINNVNITLIEELDRTANEITILAKNTDTYIDRTNNLRSSIGYVLYRDGVKVGASFYNAGSGDEGDGKDGVKKGEMFADDIAKNYEKGFVVVLVAGMDYAAYVEAKNYDVLTGASMQFDDVLKQNFEIIKNVTGIDFNKIE